MALTVFLIWISFSRVSETHALTLVLLLLNAIYSGVVYFLAKRRGQIGFMKRASWIDFIWYSAFVSVNYINYPIFVVGFLFVILTAAFHGGLKSGRLVTAASVAMIFGISVVHFLLGTELALGTSLRLTVYLMVLGYIISYWGGLGFKLERRLAFLERITQLANPRFGADQTIDLILQQLRSFYDADSCLLVMADAKAGKTSVRRMKPGSQGHASVEVVEGDVANRLLSGQSEFACIWTSKAKRWWGRRDSRRLYHLNGQEASRGQLSVSEDLINTIDADSLIIVPVLCYGDQHHGRLFIVNPKHGTAGADVLFLIQVIDHVMRGLENIRLVDRLATEAAEMERQKIARDIHDSIVQPYIGISIGLSAIRRKVQQGLDPARDINRLIHMTETEITDLRTYMNGLKGSRTLEINFVQAVRRLASKFADASGIRIEVVTDKDVLINDRLAAEAFQIIAEGLSNVRKHTQATRASVSIKCHGDEFAILIRNNMADGHAQNSFTPRSIAERTAALGGRVSILRNNGTTTLNVTIPL